MRKKPFFYGLAIGLLITLVVMVCIRSAPRTLAATISPEHFQRECDVPLISTVRTDAYLVATSSDLVLILALLAELRISCKLNHVAEVRRTIAALASLGDMVIPFAATEYLLCLDNPETCGNWPSDRNLRFSSAILEVLRLIQDRAISILLVKCFASLDEKASGSRNAGVSLGGAEQIDGKSVRVLAGSLARLLCESKIPSIRGAIGSAAKELYPQINHVDVRVALLKLMHGSYDFSVLAEMLLLESDDKVRDQLSLMLAGYGNPTAIPIILESMTQSLARPGIVDLTARLRALLTLAPLRDILPSILSTDTRCHQGQLALLGLCVASIGRKGELDLRDFECLKEHLYLERTSHSRLRFLLQSLEREATRDPEIPIVSALKLRETEDKGVAFEAMDNIAAGASQDEFLACLSYAVSKWDNLDDSRHWAGLLCRYIYNRPAATAARAALLSYISIARDDDHRCAWIEHIDSGFYGQEVSEVFCELLSELRKLPINPKVESLRSEVQISNASGIFPRYPKHGR